MLAAFALVGAFFVDWVHVKPAEARRLQEAAEAQLTGDTSEVAEHWRTLNREMVEKEAVSGLDVFSWTRAARAWTAPRRPGETAPASEEKAERAILVLAVLLASLPIGGAILGLYFLTHRFRRATSPVLILSMLLGVVAVGIPALYRIGEGVVGQETDPAIGLTALSLLGGVLLLVGAFGVKAENWWRVFAGALATGGALGVLGWVYVTSGIVP
jgi:hypothetical protein